MKVVKDNDPEEKEKCEPTIVVREADKTNINGVLEFFLNKPFMFRDIEGIVYVLRDLKYRIENGLQDA